MIFIYKADWRKTYDWKPLLGLSNILNVFLQSFPQTKYDNYYSMSGALGHVGEHLDGVTNNCSYPQKRYIYIYKLL
jgi:hypothetical protein